MEVGVDPFMVVSLENNVAADKRHTKSCNSCIYTSHSISHGSNGQDGMVLPITPSVQCLSDAGQPLPRIQQQHLIQYPQLNYEGGLTSSQLDDHLGMGQMLSELYQGSYQFASSQALNNSFLAPITVQQPVHVQALPAKENELSKQESAADLEPTGEESAYPLDDFEYYKEIEKYLTSEQYPLSASENYKKRLQKRAQHYVIINGVLHHGRKHHKEVVMKKQDRKEMLKKIHIVVNSGVHLGVKKMFGIIQKEYFWRGMYVDVVNYVKQCAKCSELFDVASQLKAKEGGTSEEELDFDNPSDVSILKNISTQASSSAWQKVEIQVNGPYKVTNSRNEFIITITDTETHFICACALPASGLSTRVSEFIVRIFCLFGFPKAYIVCEQELFEVILSEYKWRVDGLTENVLLHRIDTPECTWVHQLLVLLVSSKPTGWDREMDGFLFKFKIGTIKQFVGTLPLSPFTSMYGRAPFCHSEVENKENLVNCNKLLQWNKTRSYQCTHCERVFPSKLSLLIHQQKNKKQMKHKSCYSLARRRQRRGHNQEGESLVSHALHEVDFKPPEAWVESTVNAVKSYLAETKEKRKKRGKYQKFTAELHEQMAEYALKNGFQKAAQFFSQSLGTRVSDSTIRNITKSHASFEASLREEIGMFAVNFGVKNATCYFSKSLNRSIPQTLVQKFKSLYLNKYPGLTSNDEKKVKGPSKNKNKTSNDSLVLRRLNKNKYTEITKEEIGLYACNHSISDTIKYCKENLGITVNEKVVRKFYRAYLNKKGVPRIGDELLTELQPVLAKLPTLETVGNNLISYTTIVDTPLDSHLYEADTCIQPHINPVIISQTDDFSFNSAQSEIESQQLYNQASSVSTNYQEHPGTSVPPAIQAEEIPPCIATQDLIIASENDSENFFHMNIDPVPPVVNSGSVKVENDSSSQKINHQPVNNNDSPLVFETDLCTGDPQKSQIAVAGVRLEKPQGKSTLKTKKKCKKKRGSYTTYSPELRAEIGKYAAEHGNLKACSYFSQLLGHDVPESTARGLKEKYLSKVQHCNVTSLGYSPRGRPLRLGKYDEVVQECLKEILRSGEKVSAFLAITTAKEILNKYDPGLLQENGGNIVLNTTWAKSFLKRIGVRNNS